MIKTTVHTYSDELERTGLKAVIEGNKVFTEDCIYNFDTDLSIKIFIYKNKLKAHEIRRVKRR